MRFGIILVFAVLFSVLFTSCHTHRKALRRAEKEREARGEKGGDKRNGDKYTTADYINMYHKAAVKQMKNHGIPASITLAQGILESANGNSELARNANNHFGIKCTKDWKGKTYYHYASEGNSCFRRYPNVEASYEDHAAFLHYKRYEFLYALKTKDYKGWAKGLKKAGYATNPKYPELLINLIEKYDLHKFDK